MPLKGVSTCIVVWNFGFIGPRCDASCWGPLPQLFPIGAQLWPTILIHRFALLSSLQSACRSAVILVQLARGVAVGNTTETASFPAIDASPRTPLPSSLAIVATCHLPLLFHRVLPCLCLPAFYSCRLDEKIYVGRIGPWYGDVSEPWIDFCFWYDLFLLIWVIKCHYPFLSPLISSWFLGFINQCLYFSGESLYANCQVWIHVLLTLRLPCSTCTVLHGHVLVELYRIDGTNCTYPCDPDVFCAQPVKNSFS